MKRVRIIGKTFTLKTKQGVPGETGKTGEKGTPGPQGTQGNNGLRGSDGHTPEKGVDYFTDDEIFSVVKEVKALIPVPKDGSPDTGQEMVKKLESLPKGKRLSYTKLDDLPNDFLFGSNSSSSDDATTTTVLSVVTKTLSYTATNDDDVILVDATAGSRTVTLPSVASATLKRFTVKKIDSSANSVIIRGNGAELIDGFNTQQIDFQYTSVDLIPNGSFWSLA